MAKKAAKSKSAKKSKAPKAAKKSAGKSAKPSSKHAPPARKATKTKAGAKTARAKGETPKAPRKAKAPKYSTAESMAKKQRSISVSEFFAKNRHLLGFDNPRKALLTTIKEAVDNSLDACEEAGINPRIEVSIEQLSDTNYRVTIEDNGPGIVRSQIPNIFGSLLYGSKFHAMKMARGQQGIGISAAGMYGLMTTGKNVVITSRTGPRKQAHHYELRINTRTNKPDILVDEVVEWDAAHGTKVTIELVAKYQKGRASVDAYLEQTAIANPHATFLYNAPDGRREEYIASSPELPPPAKSVLPHPYGVELGVLIKMLHDTKARTITQFLTSEFSRVSPRVAQDILDAAKISPRARPNRIARQEAHNLHESMQSTKILAPRTDSVVPIGEEQLLAGLKQVVDADFYTVVTRSPSVYRGNPFIVEAALAYGKGESAQPRPGRSEAEIDEEEFEGPESDQPTVKVIRFANRVPLLYQQSACAIYRSLVGLNWRSYGLQQSRGALPSGPATIVVHIASIWVPFTSESKEAVADYPEITKEIKLALQQCGRRLGTHVRKQVRQRNELKKRSYIQKYIPHIGLALGEILGLKDKQVDTVNDNLTDILERSRKM